MSSANPNPSTRSKTPRWLTLSEAAQFLGIHPTTLRRWADDGDVHCIRTPGGHRRFREKDLQTFLGAQEQGQGDASPTLEALANTLVSQTRRELSERDIAEKSWRTAFDRTERAARRESGRRLLGLAIQFTSRSTGREAILEEARYIGQEYGRDAAERGLSLVDTTRAFLFFRETLIRAARPGLSNRGQYDAEDIHIHRSLREFLDEVFFAAMAVYERTTYRSLSSGAPQ